MQLVDRLIASSLPAVPRPLVRRLADRYMAGEHLTDAVRTVAGLNRRGATATVDVLGEFVHDRDQAQATKEEYLGLLDALSRAGLDANISVKLTALGLEVDPGLCRDLLGAVVGRARELETFVRIDMEHSAVTSQTLAIYRELREAGHDGVGVVIQSYLKRSIDDVRALADLLPRVRLVKGIYVEPAAIAYTDPAEINRSFVHLLEELMDGGSHVAIATHDESLVTAAQRLARERGLDRERYEFQLLLGVKEQLRDRLIASGERVRIYVPYGEAWYGYSVRRLKENPSIAGYVARDLLRGVVRR